MSEITDRLRQTFDLAALRHEAQQNLTGEDWEQLQKIKAQHGQDRAAVERHYEEHRPELVADERRQIINESTGIDRSFMPPWSSTDKFEKTEIDRRAHQRVDAHERKDIDAIDASEKAALKKLVDGAKPAERPEQKQLSQFQENAADIGERQRRSQRRSFD